MAIPAEPVWLPITPVLFRKDPGASSVHDVPVGMRDNPSILGKEFYLLYTRLPNGLGWNGASVDRFTVSCP